MRWPDGIVGRMSRHLSLILAVVGALVGPAAGVHAQSEPYNTGDTRPVITQGPYLIATASSTATIVWLTDTPSHSLVKYGLGAALTAAALTESVEPERDGLVPVGLRHVVHLTGLTPGAIQEALGVPAATLSFHLKELVNAGLVTQERASRNLIYRAHYEHMNALLAYLTQNCCQGAACAVQSSSTSCAC